MMIKQERGFSIVELLTAMVVTSFLLMAIYLAVNTTQRDSVAIEGKVAAQADAKTALDIMALEISMASYNANFEIEAWPDPNSCALAVNQNLRGIQIATANTIVVAMDADDTCKDITPPSGCVGDGSNEVIRYNYVTAGAAADPNAERHITRTTNCDGAQPFLGDTAAAMADDKLQRNVRVNNVDLVPAIPLFRYFDGQNRELIPSPATLTGTARRLNNTTIPDIRRIVITLAVETGDPDIRGVRRQLFYSTSVIPRNHAITP